MKFNVNKIVRVRLTDLGRRLHRQHHDALCETIGKEVPYLAPKEDYEGWSEWQLWSLMSEFGNDITCGMSVPFETEIDIPLPPNG